MTLVTAVAVSLLLAGVLILVHFQTLDLISRVLPRLRLPHRVWIIVVMFGVFVGHLIEVGLFALAYPLLQHGLGMGHVEPGFDGTALDYFHISATAFTTLGMTGPQPEGGLKVVAALEALTGFLLITWSASFGYTALKDFWKDNPGGGEGRG